MNYTKIEFFMSAKKRNIILWQASDRICYNWALPKNQ